MIDTLGEKINRQSLMTLILWHIYNGEWQQWWLTGWTMCLRVLVLLVLVCEHVQEQQTNENSNKLTTTKSTSRNGLRGLQEHRLLCARDLPCVRVHIGRVVGLLLLVELLLLVAAGLIGGRVQIDRDLLLHLIVVHLIVVHLLFGRRQLRLIQEGQLKIFVIRTVHKLHATVVGVHLLLLGRCLQL